ncbi:MAG: hypothetical protein LBJ10_05895 [Clostridiales bacterium]|jgi:hypothetical protein|nr:hypothetical protein [Clostridiales bacterium]
MAANRVIVTAGDCVLKKEHRLASAGGASPGTFVMPVAGGVAVAAAGYARQIAILDYSSEFGLETKPPEGGKAYAEGDLVPILYPAAGCEVNAAADTSGGGIADGDLLAIAEGGMLKKPAPGEEAAAIAIARESVAIVPGTPAKVKAEILRQ